MKLLKVTFENFRGVREATYEFSDLTKIKGCNGSGKSTIASAFFWIFADKDITLVSNPNVRPTDSIDEIVTTVTADMEIADKPVQVQKSQKLKRSKTGVVSLTNSYMVNSVPKSEKAFKEYMENLGFDFDKFLPCSHPGVLLAGINNKKERTALRNLLFQMASDITDWDVANGDPELAAIVPLLKDYDTEEIEAIQNNTLRKIRENYGKEGEILRAKIEGLESAKVDVPVEFLKNEITDIKGKSEKIQSEIDALNEKLKAINDASAGLLEKKFKLNQMEQDAVKDDVENRAKIERDLFLLENQESKLKRGIEEINRTMENERAYAEDLKNKAKLNTDHLEGIKNQCFSGSEICPTCGQRLPEDKINEAKANFENRKKDKIAQFEETIKQQKANALMAVDRIENCEKELKEKSGELKTVSKSIEETKQTLNDMGDVKQPDMSDNKEYQDLLTGIANDEIFIDGTDRIRDEIRELKLDLKDLKTEETNKRVELSKVDQNLEIDRKIEELRHDQINYEQQKANAEMILDQLRTLNMKKNNMLQDSVNSHFDLINWQLFEFRKNGTPIDTCIPTINGKKFGESMNTGLETLARIDAMNSIQRFFNLDFPIWLDNAEHLDSNSLANIKTDHQLIVMTVTDDERLVFEND